MDGYVIESATGKFLSAGGFWFPHDAPENAWIHPHKGLGWMITTKWTDKPARAYPASLRNGKTVITGPAVNFDELVRR